jgi:hypothetical protein
MLLSFYIKQDKHNSSKNLLLFDFDIELHAISGGMNTDNNLNKREKNDVELPLFSYESVSATTNDFSTTNKLGGGGFGPIYKVYKIHSSHEFASKQLRQPIMVNFNESLKSLWFAFIRKIT